jgi:formylglycine-generating enzyme required for sulfatase activity
MRMRTRSCGWVAALLLAGTFGCAYRDPAFQLVHLKGGCYRMGTEPGTPGGPEEKPAHDACVRDFDLGKFEVTQDQWVGVMNSNPSYHQKCGTCAVEMVSWNDVQEFIARLNKHTSDGKYRLPTEAEWEYAARAGKADRYSGVNDDPDAVAWYTGNTNATHPVGTKAPNAFGLQDMSGNVWEWTADWYDPGYYAVSPKDDPRGPEKGTRRVMRGGSYADQAFDQRVTYRNYLPPDYRGQNKGFRVVKVPAK